MTRCRACAIASRAAIDARWLVLAGAALLARLARMGTSPERALCGGCVTRLRDLLSTKAKPRRTRRIH